MGVLYVITQPGFLWPEGVLPGTQPEQVNPSSSPWVAPELGKSYRKQWNLAQSCWQPRCEQFGGVQPAMREKKANTEREAESKGVERVQTLVSTWLANFNSSRCQLHPSPSCSLDVSFLSFHEPNNSLFAKASWSWISVPCNKNSWLGAPFLFDANISHVYLGRHGWLFVCLCGVFLHFILLWWGHLT